MEILPHQENWELCRENAHPNAQSLFSEEWYWDAIDDYAPFGNDTGADTLYFYSREVSRDPTLRGDRILDSLLHSWDMNPRWEATDEDAVAKVLEVEPYGIDTSDDAAIAIAFAQILLFGAVEEESRDRALGAVARATLPSCLAQGGFPEDRLMKLHHMKTVLTKADLR
jgi:uncharacterized protein YfeS